MSLKNWLIFFSFFKVPVTENEMDVMLHFFGFMYRSKRSGNPDDSKLDRVLSSMTRVSLYSLCLSFNVLLIYWCRSEFPKTLLISL